MFQICSILSQSDCVWLGPCGNGNKP